MQVEEKLMNIELYLRRVGFTTQIGTQMKQEVMQEVVRVLRENADIFAFSPLDMTGIPSEIAMHYLNVDPKVRP